MKHYILEELNNHEEIIILVIELKYPTTVLKTSGPTSLSNEYEKDPIMVMIQTEDIKQYVKKISTLRQNIINTYRIIWIHCSPVTHK